MMIAKRKHGASDLLSGTLLYVILVVLFAIGLFSVIQKESNSADSWEELYVKELALLLNQARPGDVYTIDIQKASEIAVKNGIKDTRYIIRFDGKTREVVVQLHQGGETRFSYFNDVVVADSTIELGRPRNTLSFRVVAPEMHEEQRT
jgi:hypothetical protein